MFDTRRIFMRYSRQYGAIVKAMETGSVSVFNDAVMMIGEAKFKGSEERMRRYVLDEWLSKWPMALGVLVNGYAVEYVRHGWLVLR